MASCLFWLCLSQFWIGILNKETDTTAPPVSPHPHRHASHAGTTETSVAEKPLLALKPSPKRYKCGIPIRPGCTCSKSEGSLSITCFKAGLKKVPVFDFGPIVVRTMNLERNRIQSINIGDFYGLKIERLLLANNSIHNLNFLAFWGLEYNLDTLDLGFNKFNSVPADALRLLRNVKTLSLTGNKILSLRNYEFSYLHKLEVLSLDKNPISYMEPRTFAGTNLFMLMLDQIDMADGLQIIPTNDLRRLKGLSLKRNSIRNIPDGWMRNLTSLKFLNLDDNKLNKIKDDAFKGIAHTLRNLKMNHNKVRKIPREAFRDLSNLETLELSHNRIRKLYARSFNNSKAMQTLDLRNNAIGDMGVSALEGMDALSKLDLRYNELVALDQRTFFWKDKSNRKVYISENPWLCNCLIKWIKKEFRKRSVVAGMFSDIHDARCKRPFILEGKPIFKVPVKDFTCTHEYYYYEYDDYEEEEYYEYEEEEEDNNVEMKEENNEIMSN